MLAITPIDPVAFHRDRLPALIEQNGAMAAKAAHGLPPLAVKVDDNTWTYAIEAGTVTVTPGRSDGSVLAIIGLEGWSGYVDNLLTVPGLLLTAAVTVAAEDTMTLSYWDSGLRALFSGIPPYDPTTVPLNDADGNPLDLKRSFTLDDTDADILAQLTTVGFVRIRNVFTADEIATFNAEVDRLSGLAIDGDDTSWWSDHDGERVLNRMIYTEDRSDVFAPLAEDARMLRLAGLHEQELRISTDRMDGMTVLIKPPGDLHGLANIPWHQDCGMGGHDVLCPAVGMGIQLTGADAEQSQFVGIAGSHGMTAHPLLTEEQLATMPLVPVDTDPGDVTLHIADVIHASPPPAGDGGRRTLYLTAFPLTLFDVVGPGEAFNDLVRGRNIGVEDLAGSDA